jgi:hypothetical protein
MAMTDEEYRAAWAEERDRAARAVRQALRECGDGFRQFSRNGRWGCCGECPRTDGHAYPEFCALTDRYDHQLGAADLADCYERHVKIAGGRTGVTS